MKKKRKKTFELTHLAVELDAKLEPILFLQQIL